MRKITTKFGTFRLAWYKGVAPSLLIGGLTGLVSFFLYRYALTEGLQLGYDMGDVSEGSQNLQGI